MLKFDLLSTFKAYKRDMYIIDVMVAVHINDKMLINGGNLEILLNTKKIFMEGGDIVFKKVLSC